MKKQILTTKYERRNLGKKEKKKKKKEQRDAAYKDFKTKTEGKETQNLIKKLKRILEEIEIEWQKIIRQ